MVDHHHFPHETRLNGGYPPFSDRPTIAHLDIPQNGTARLFEPSVIGAATKCFAAPTCRQWLSCYKPLTWKLPALLGVCRQSLGSLGELHLRPENGSKWHIMKPDPKNWTLIQTHWQIWASGSSRPSLLLFEDRPFSNIGSIRARGARTPHSLAGGALACEPGPSLPISHLSHIDPYWVSMLCCKKNLWNPSWNAGFQIPRPLS